MNDKTLEKINLVGSIIVLRNYLEQFGIPGKEFVSVNLCRRCQARMCYERASVTLGDEIHIENKKMFFSCLKPETVTYLEPVYE